MLTIRSLLKLLLIPRKPLIILFLDLLMTDVDLLLQLDSQCIFDILLIYFQVHIILEKDGVVVYHN